MLPQLPPLPPQPSLASPADWRLHYPPQDIDIQPGSSWSTSSSRQPLKRSNSTSPRRLAEFPNSGENTNHSRAPGAAPPASNSGHTPRARTQSHTRSNSRVPLPVQASANSTDLVIIPPIRTHSRSASIGLTRDHHGGLPSFPKKHSPPPPLPSLDHLPPREFAFPQPAAKSTSAGVLVSVATTTTTTTTSTSAPIAIASPPASAAPQSAPPRQSSRHHHHGSPQLKHVEAAHGTPPPVSAPIASPPLPSPPYSAPVTTARRSEKDRDREKERLRQKDRERERREREHGREKERPVLVVFNPDQPFLDMAAPDDPPPSYASPVRAPTPPRGTLRRQDSARRPAEPHRAETEPPMPVRKDSTDRASPPLFRHPYASPAAGQQSMRAQQEAAAVRRQESVRAASRPREREDPAHPYAQAGGAIVTRPPVPDPETVWRPQIPESARQRLVQAQTSGSGSVSVRAALPLLSSTRGRTMEVPTSLRVVPETPITPIAFALPEPEPEPVPEPEPASAPAPPTAYARKWVLEKKGKRLTQDSIVVVQQLRMLR